MRVALSEPRERAGERLLRRMLDVTVAGGLLLGLLPLLAALGLLVRCTSPGPMLFRQQRVGRGGRQFRLYKLRTMRGSAGGLSVTAAGDARVTPVGRWLRAWKLDELPQLWNVLIGEMSLVGPRPEVPEYAAGYTAEQRQALAVRPGLTGPTQLAFRHEERLLAEQEDVESYYRRVLLPVKLQMDLEYVRTRSLGGDLRLLARTAAVLLWQPAAGARGE